MIPMPEDALALQLDMKAMYTTLAEIDYPSGTPHLSPQLAFMIACIGEQELHSRQILRLGYWFGTNISHPINYLAKEGVVKKRTPPDDKRIIYFSLTPKGLALCERIRKALTNDKENSNATRTDSNRSDYDTALSDLCR